LIRLFVGLKIPDDVCKKLSSLCSGLANVRWVKKENFHVTLQFIGEVQENWLEDLVQSLSEVKFSQFDLTLSGVNFFGSARIVKSIWVGIKEKEDLLRLYSKISMSIEKVGIDFKRRKFTPHVSIARFVRQPGRKFQNYIEENSLFNSRTFSIKSFTLFESVLKPNGPIYLTNSTFFPAR